MPTYQFKIRGLFVGGTTAFSEIVQYEVVCGKEILAITQNVIPGTDDFIYTYDQSGVIDAAGGDSTPSATMLTGVYSAFMTDNSSALCPIDSWALFETTDESNEAMMSTDSRITIDGYSAGKTYTITYLKYDPSATTTGAKNYYEHIYVRGYTKARYNTLRPVTIKTTMKLVFDICGWENVTEPTVATSGNSDISTFIMKQADDGIISEIRQHNLAKLLNNIVLIPNPTTYFVEVGTNRSITWTFTDYTTDSTVWATDFPVSTDFANASLYAAG